MRPVTPRTREALVLRFWLDLSEREMAEAMSISPGTVKSTVSRGLAALAQALGDQT
jgi:RNA polymerase sigma factor (sigma-70 family)